MSLPPPARYAEHTCCLGLTRDYFSLRYEPYVQYSTNCCHRRFIRTCNGRRQLYPRYSSNPSPKTHSNHTHRASILGKTGPHSIPPYARYPLQNGILRSFSLRKYKIHANTERCIPRFMALSGYMKSFSTKIHVKVISSSRYWKPPSVCYRNRQLKRNRLRRRISKPWWSHYTALTCYVCARLLHRFCLTRDSYE